MCPHAHYYSELENVGAQPDVILPDSKSRGTWGWIFDPSWSIWSNEKPTSDVFILESGQDTWGLGAPRGADSKSEPSKDGSQDK